MVASEVRLPRLEDMIVSPSDFNLSTKLSTSFPLAPSFRALLGPEGLSERIQNKKKIHTIKNKHQQTKTHTQTSTILDQWSFP